MDFRRDGASRTRPLVVAVVVTVVIASVGAVSVGGSSAMGAENPPDWSPNPGKEITADNGTSDSNRTTTNQTDQTDEIDETTGIDVPACRANETESPSESNETTATFGDGGTTPNDIAGDDTGDSFGTESTPDTTSNESAFPVATDGSAQVVFADQNTTGTSVVVEAATPPDSGFVVIHDASLLREGEVEASVIGVSDFLDAQQHEDVEVPLAGALTERRQLVAVVYRDTDGNGEFGFGDDPYRDGGDSVVADDALVNVLGESEQTPTTNGTNETVEACPPAENDTRSTNGSAFDEIDVDMPAGVVFDDQESNGTAVTVGSVTVPEGGYVVIHDTSLLQGEVEGSVVGVSEFLDAGMHESIPIRLDERLTTEQPLIAVVYRGGDPPNPYTDKNGTAIADDALVTVLGDEGTNSSVTNQSTPTNTSESSVTDASATSTPADEPFGETETATATRTAVETTSPAEPFGEAETTTAASAAIATDGPTNAQTTTGRDEQTAGNAGEEETTQTEAPGFGVVSALAALLSIGLFVIRRE